MLLQTNSYIVPKEKRVEHARLLRRFRHVLARIGCDHFETYEQVGANWNSADPTGRYVQIMRFRDRRHQQRVSQSERTDPAAQAVIAEFCRLINLPYQQQQGLFAVGFYTSVLPVATPRAQPAQQELADPFAGESSTEATAAAFGGLTGANTGMPASDDGLGVEESYEEIPADGLGDLEEEAPIEEPVARAPAKKGRPAPVVAQPEAVQEVEDDLGLPEEAFNDEPEAIGMSLPGVPAQGPAAKAPASAAAPASPARAAPAARVQATAPAAPAAPKVAAPPPIAPAAPAKPVVVPPAAPVVPPAAAKPPVAPPPVVVEVPPAAAATQPAAPAPKPQVIASIKPAAPVTTPPKPPAVVERPAVAPTPVAPPVPAPAAPAVIAPVAAAVAAAPVVAAVAPVVVSLPPVVEAKAQAAATPAPVDEIDLRTPEPVVPAAEDAVEPLAFDTAVEEPRALETEDHLPVQVDEAPAAAEWIHEEEAAPADHAEPVLEQAAELPAEIEPEWSLEEEPVLEELPAPVEQKEVAPVAEAPLHEPTEDHLPVAVDEPAPLPVEAEELIEIPAVPEPVTELPADDADLISLDEAEPLALDPAAVESADPIAPLPEPEPAAEPIQPEPGSLEPVASEAPPVEWEEESLALADEAPAPAEPQEHFESVAVEPEPVAAAALGAPAPIDWEEETLSLADEAAEPVEAEEHLEPVALEPEPVAEPVGAGDCGIDMDLVSLDDEPLELAEAPAPARAAPVPPPMPVPPVMPVPAVMPAAKVESPRPPAPPMPKPAIAPPTPAKEDSFVALGISADEDPFTDLPDAQPLEELPITDFANEERRATPAAVRPSTGEGGMRKRVEVFTDNDIDAALNDALKDLEGFGEETAPPPKRRPASSGRR